MNQRRNEVLDTWAEALHMAQAPLALADYDLLDLKILRDVAAASVLADHLGVHLTTAR